MKKLIILMVFILFFCVQAHAEETLGTEELYENLPQQSQSFLEDIGINSVLDSLEMNFGRFFENISEIFRSKYITPLKTFFIICAIVALGSFINAFDETIKITEIACTLAVCAFCIPNISQLILNTSEVTQSVSVVILSSIPIYAMLHIASGSPITAGAFSTTAIFMANVFTALCNTVIIPSISIFLGISVASVFSHIKMKTFCNSIYSVIKWSLVTVITLFSATISVQAALCTASDMVSNKTMKFIASSTVPIVGSAFGDGIGAVQNSIKLLKSGSGAFGIIACLVIFLPIIIEIVLWLLSMQMSVIISEMFGFQKIADLSSIIIIILKLLFAITMSFALIFIVISAITLFFGA